MMVLLCLADVVKFPLKMTAWDCGVCRFQNQESENSCAMCGMQKLINTTSKNWCCQVCKYTNEFDRCVCATCNSSSLKMSQLDVSQRLQAKTNVNGSNLKIKNRTRILL